MNATSGTELKEAWLANSTSRKRQAGVVSSHKHGALRKFARNYAGLCGLILLILVAIGVVLAPFLAPYDPIQLDLGKQFRTPGSPVHLLGTDTFGWDILCRILLEVILLI